MNIYQSNTCGKNFSWQHFDHEQRAQEMQQMKNQQYYIPVFEAYLIVLSLARGTNPGMTTVFQVRLDGKFIGIWSTLRLKNFLEQIKALIFLEAVLAIEIK